MSFNPINASKEITDKYLRYLSTVFDINDEDYKKQLDEQLHGTNSLAKGPYLDVTDSFEQGASIEELIKEGELSPFFSLISQKKLPIERPLYKHQEIAVRVANSGANMVVSTGTGSGKTECFLIPILNEMMREMESTKKDKLSPGVRALLIYPMNALANDQIDRLREMLKDFPGITYGSYTGQTQRTYKDALADYKTLNKTIENPDPVPAKNELISREQMKETPPNILITNYAMLEYLMLRPGDAIFFDQQYADKWKYIILDEAHVYGGSTGIEVSMLLRRLKATLDNDKIKYILTSATLGGENENDKVAEFASNLCDSDFYANNVIRAVRRHIELSSKKELGIEFYREIASLINDGYEDSFIIEKIEELCNEKANTSSLEEVLFNYVKEDSLYAKIKELLIEPNTVSKIAKTIGISDNDLCDFVTVASKAIKDGNRIFDARYHMFLRATDSAYITLSPNKKLFLTRQKEVYEGDEIYKVFEIATCVFCHSIYLVGEIENDRLIQTADAHSGKRQYFLLADKYSNDNEDEELDEEYEEYEICPHCGFVRRANASGTKCCEHSTEEYVKIIKVIRSEKNGKITKCAACENSNYNTGVLRMLFTGQEAVTSVVGTALFETLPAYKVKRVATPTVIDDDFGEVAGNVEEQKEATAKQFIAFSDNRQAAAYYATYLDETYRTYLYKKMILDTLDLLNKETTLDIFAKELKSRMENKRIIRKGDDSQKEAWKAIFKELVDIKNGTSLSSLGLIKLGIKIPEFKYPSLELSENEFKSFCNAVAADMVKYAAFDTSSLNMSQADEEYYLNSPVSYGFTLSDSDKYTKSFIPKISDRMNSRIDYYLRIAKHNGKSFENSEVEKKLESIWQHILINKEIINNNTDGGNKYRLSLDKITISKTDDWYICPKCNKITNNNVKGVCPTYKCSGELQSVNIEELMKNNHYYRLCKDIEERPLRIVEHTAQLNKDTAYDYQKKFKNKEIDILSCSTTFEMGVDVGSLETVLMRNMPPTAANYAQRAGRAGRSSESAAFALTFCNRSNHDFTFYDRPVEMIKGKISPPSFNVENPKIAIRHLYASSFGMFWKKYRDMFDDLSKMYDIQEGFEENGFELYRKYLKSKPNALKNYAFNFLPVNLREHKDFRISDFGWIDGLISNDKDNPGRLTVAIDSVRDEIETLEQKIQENIEKDRKTDYLRDRIRNYKSEPILSFLSRKNVLPKYGFPVDTVELKINDNGPNINHSVLGLQLQRDLSIALSEYAPGSQIVANGNLITSQYIAKRAQIAWKKYDYHKCDECQTLNIAVNTSDLGNNPELENCKQCQKKLKGTDKGTFIIPEFGFVAGDKIERPKLIKPERTYNGDIAYIGGQEMSQKDTYEINNAIIEVYSSQNDQMAVLNTSNFYVCERCGYTELDNSCHNLFKNKVKHRGPSGYSCDGSLYKRALGYIFATDVIQFRFLNPELKDWETALSVLYGIIKGICYTLNIEQDELSGCLQSFNNLEYGANGFALVIYDKTPGGAGHVRRLNNQEIINKVLSNTYMLMASCDCGGEEANTSCYKCLRNYYNQKFHEYLERGHVLKFIDSINNCGPISAPNAFKEHYVMKQDSGTTAVGKSPKEVWTYIKEDLIDEREIAFFTQLEELSEECSFERPIYNCNLMGLDSRETASADLLFEKHKVVYICTDRETDYEKLKNSDWTVFSFIEGDIDLNEFLNYIKE